jgi:hypothetical protein
VCVVEGEEPTSRKVKGGKGLVLRATVKKVASNLLAKSSLNNNSSLKQFSKLGITNFVSLNRVKFVYSKKRLIHQQLVLHSAKKFPLLNFYYRARRLRKVRITKLVQLSKKNISSRTHAPVAPLKSIKLKRVREFLNKRRGRLLSVRGKLKTKYSKIASKGGITSVKSSDSSFKNLDLKKVYNRK